MNQKLLLFSTNSSLKLSKKIANYYGNNLNKIKFIKFSDGEYVISFKESVFNKQIFIIGSTFPPADNLMELLLICDTAKRASAKDITLVIPYFGWARQDRKDKPNTSISAKLVANLITSAGATRIITMDLHADQIEGFFDISVNHIYSYNIFMKYIKKLKLENLTFASPDMGGTKRARNYAIKFGCSVIVCYKERNKANEIEFMKLIGDVKNKNVIIVDDIVDTAGTLTKAANLIKKKGALSVRAIVTHPILSGDAYQKIENSHLSQLITTNTIPIKILSPKIEILNCASILAETMYLINNKK